MMKLLAIVLSLFMLAGCSTRQATESVIADNNMNKDELRFSLLQSAFAQWQGSPYQFGGNSKNGIDCSSFVQIVYRDSFNVALPRTTAQQVEQGNFVYREQLRVGDLVFFKTGWQARHVGIYTGGDDFIHASSSKGVTRSSLNNVYWKANYWQARRILD